MIYLVTSHVKISDLIDKDFDFFVTFLSFQIIDLPTLPFTFIMTTSAAASSTVAESELLRNLASSNPEKRDAAVEKLRQYLSYNPSFSSAEALKLWKGLYYAMWMCDKPLPQQRLAAELADLINVLKDDSVIPFIDTFFKTMSREWSGIDGLRMDKFLMLVRFYLRSSFNWLAKSNWRNSGARKDFLEILEDTPLSAKDIRVPNGLRYHVLDIYVDELEKVLPEEQDNIESVPAEEMLGPVKKLTTDSPTKAVRLRAREAMGDERVKKWLGIEDEVVAPEAAAPDEDDGGFGGFDD
jgi:ribosomal RNA-processing protein 1